MLALGFLPSSHIYFFATRVTPIESGRNSSLIQLGEKITYLKPDNSILLSIQTI